MGQSWRSHNEAIATSLALCTVNVYVCGGLYWMTLNYDVNALWLNAVLEVISLNFFVVLLTWRYKQDVKTSSWNHFVPSCITDNTKYTTALKVRQKFLMRTFPAYDKKLTHRLLKGCLHYARMRTDRQTDRQTDNHNTLHPSRGCRVVEVRTNLFERWFKVLVSGTCDVFTSQRSFTVTHLHLLIGQDTVHSPRPPQRTTCWTHRPPITSQSFAHVGGAWWPGWSVATGCHTSH